MSAGLLRALGTVQIPAARGFLLLVVAIASHCREEQAILAQGVDLAELTRDDLIAAWTARQETIRSARITWTETEIRHRPEGTIAGLGTVPPLVQEIRTVNLFAFDEERAKIAERDAGDDPSAPWDLVSVFDGESQRALEHSDATEYPQGIVSHQPVPDPSLAKYQPLLVHFSPLRAGRAPFPLRSVTMTGDFPLDQDNRPCVEVLISGSAGSKRRLRVDPERDFVIVRSAHTSSSGSQTEMTIHYHALDGVTWTPSGWTIERRNSDGRVTHHIEAQVTKTDLNVTLSDEEFEVEFPPGTRYIDNDARKLFIVQEGSVPREYTRLEMARGATQEELMTTKTGFARSVVPRRQSRGRWLLMINALAIVAIVAYLIGRRRGG